MAVPSLSSVSPTSYTADNNTHTMTLFGTNFVSGDTLTYVDPQGDIFSNRAPTFISSTQLQYSFNDGNDPGVWTVRVNSSSGSSGTSSFSVTSAAPAPTLSSVSPTSYTADNNAHTMTLSGTNFVSGDTLTYVDPQGDVFSNRTPTFISSTQLQYSFNDSNDPGSWSVQVNGPSGNSSSSFFTVTTATAPAPTLSSVSPTSYTADNNAHTMTLSGTNFVSGDTLTYVDPQGDVFSNRTPTFISSTQLQYSFNDSNDAGSWSVQVNGPSGNSSSSFFTVTTATAPAPTLSSVSPTSYTADNNTHTMTLSGTNFVSGDTLTYVDPQGDVFSNRTPTFISSTQLQYSFNDSNDAGSWSVQVNGPSGNSSSSFFTVTSAAPPPTPTVTSMLPTSLPADNNSHLLDIYGTNFAAGDTLTFTDPQGDVFANKAPTIVSSTQLEYFINDGSDPGNWTVQVNTASSHSSAFTFAVNAAAPPPTPTVTSMLPTSLPADNNSHLLDIYGTNFAAGDTLTFTDPQGDVFANKAPTIVSSTQLEYFINDGNDPGNWTVQVNTASGHSSAFTFAVNAAAPPPTPTVTSMLPTSLPADNNSHLLDIYGTNFAAGDTLTFTDPQGDVFANKAPTIVSSTQLEYFINDGNDPGNWTVQVNTASGHSSAFTFAVNAAAPPPTPTVTSMLPTSLPADNSSHLLDIYGTNFAAGDTLTFTDPQGDVFANKAPTIVSSTQLEYFINDGNDPGNWTVQVNTASGHSSAFTFAVNAAAPPPTPTVTSMLPTSLPADNSSHLLDIYGTNFAAGDTLTFTDPQGDVFANKAPTIVSSTQLEYFINDGNDPGNWTVQVNTASGHSSAFTFAVNAAAPPPTPTVTSMLPTSLPADNNSHLLDIYGTNFAAGDTLTFTDPQGDVFANKAPTIVSSTQLEYFINDGNDPGNWTVQVNTASGHSSAFTFAVNAAAPPPTPTVTSMLPTSLPADNNSHLLDIYGTNFAAGDTLTFTDPQGDVFANKAPTIVSSTQLEYFINDGSDPGNWTVQVNTASGHSSAFTFAVNAAAPPPTPTVTSMLPTSLPADNNSHLLDIYGTNFAAGDTLTFMDPQGHVQASQAPTIVSGTQLETFLNDNNESGSWTVQVNSSSGHSSAFSFAVNAASSPSTPTVTSMLPTSLTTDSSKHLLDIYGTNFAHGDTLTFTDPQGNHYSDSTLTIVSGTQLETFLNDGSDPGTWSVQVNSLSAGSSNNFTFSVTPPSTTLVADVNSAKALIDVQFNAADTNTWRTHDVSSVDQIAHDIATEYGTASSYYVIGTPANTDSPSVAANRGFTDGFINSASLLQTPDPDNSADPNQFLDQCVALVQALDHNVGGTGSWTPGAQIYSGGTIQNIAPGTPIATFGLDNKYSGEHAAFFLGTDSENGISGFLVLDQFNTGSPLYPDGTIRTDATSTYEHAEVRFISLSDPYLGEYYTIGPTTSILSQSAASSVHVDPATNVASVVEQPHSYLLYS